MLNQEKMQKKKRDHRDFALRGFMHNTGQTSTLLRNQQTGTEEITRDQDRYIMRRYSMSSTLSYSSNSSTMNDFSTSQRSLQSQGSFASGASGIQFPIQTFGKLFRINRSSWKEDINEASKNGQFVVINLTSPEVVESLVIDQMLETLATKYIYTKFVSIPAKEAADKISDNSLPTFFIYRYGKFSHHIPRFGRERDSGPDLSVELVESKLRVHGILDPPVEEFYAV